MQQVKIDNRPSLKYGDGPKVAVTVGVQEILLSMSKIQYQSLLEMLNLLINSWQNRNTFKRGQNVLLKEKQC